MKKPRRACILMFFFPIVWCVIFTSTAAQPPAKCSKQSCRNGVCERGRCVCSSSYTGTNCSVALQHHNDTTARRRVTAGLTPGLRTTVGDPQVTWCPSNPCLNGGSCSLTLRAKQGYRCQCPPGFNPKFLCHYCPRGTFGPSCRYECGVCKTKSHCDHVRGCTQCADGWGPVPTCHSINCATHASLCWHGTCIGSTNACLCEAGWEGPDCKKNVGKSGLAACHPATQKIKCKGGRCLEKRGLQVCACPPGYVQHWDPPNTASLYCLKSCVTGGKSCQFGVCERIAFGFVAGPSGRPTDPSGNSHRCVCKSGYRGRYCDRPCGKSTWGLGCQKKCSQGCRVLPCDVRSGDCGPEGCLHGYKGRKCDVEPGFDRERYVFARIQLAYRGPFTNALEDVTSTVRENLNSATRQVITAACTTLRSRCEASVSRYMEGSVLVDAIATFNSSDAQNVPIKKQLSKIMKKEARKAPTVDGYELIPDSIRVTSVTSPRDTTLATANDEGWSVSAPVALLLGSFVTGFISLVALAFAVSRYCSNRRRNNATRIQAYRGRIDRRM